MGLNPFPTHWFLDRACDSPYLISARSKVILSSTSPTCPFPDFGPIVSDAQPLVPDRWVTAVTTIAAGLARFRRTPRSVCGPVAQLVLAGLRHRRGAYLESWTTVQAVQALALHSNKLASPVEWHPFFGTPPRQQLAPILVTSAGRWSDFSSVVSEVQPPPTIPDDLVRILRSSALVLERGP